ncbi:glyoxalase/bleomycin resistance protein/dioxygenase [Pyronema omphalodes]|nr:glyoxalase/bleomycin resistance protein/dioxygenase [Pyronema omphalodes]
MPLHHICLTVADISTSKTWYSTALAPLGYKVSLEFNAGHVIGFTSGKCNPDFWLASQGYKKFEEREESLDKSITQQSPSPQTPEPIAPITGPIHIAFTTSSRQQVRNFHSAALAAGGICNGPPGPRPQYTRTYYGAFVLDPEGRNIEAVCVRPEFWAEEWGGFVWALAFAVGVLGAVLVVVGWRGVGGI